MTNDNIEAVLSSLISAEEEPGRAGAAAAAAGGEGPGPGDAAAAGAGEQTPPGQGAGAEGAGEGAGGEAGGEGGGEGQTGAGQAGAGEGGEPDPEQQGWPESAQRRVGKLTAKRHELEAKVAELEGRVAELTNSGAAGQRAETPAPSGLEQIASEGQLTKYEGNVRKVQGEVERYLEDVMEDGERQAFEGWAKENGLWKVEAEGQEGPDVRALKRLRLQCAETLRDRVPARRQHLKQTRAWTQQAEALYPQLKDPKSPFHQAVASVERNVPALTQFPSWRLWVVRMLRGYAAEQADLARSKNGGNGGTNLPGNPPPQPGRPAQGSRPPGKGALSKALKDKAFASRNDADAEAWVKNEVLNSLEG